MQNDRKKTVEEQKNLFRNTEEEKKRGNKNRFLSISHVSAATTAEENYTTFNTVLPSKITVIQQKNVLFTHSSESLNLQTCT